MTIDPRAMPESALEFLRAYHLASLTTLRPDGSPHVCTVGFTWDDGRALVRVITMSTSQKVRNAERQEAARLAGGGSPGTWRAAVHQVETGAWLTLEGVIRVEREPDQVAEAVRRYAERYRQPQPNPLRVALVIEVDRVLGRA